MRTSTVFLMVFALLVAGCGPSTGNEPPRNASHVPASGTALQLDKVVFPGGREISFDGRIVRYEFIQNAKSSLERFTVYSRDGLMSLDGAAFAELAKGGYTRRIRKEEAGLFVVNYVKKGSVTITAAYSDFNTKFPADNIQSKAVFTWQVKN